MMQSKPRSTAFRCSISPEHSSATLRIGRKKFAVNVHDTSRDGFTLRCSPAVAGKLIGKRPQLRFRGETWEIEPYRSYAESEGFHLVGCHRLRDLTPIVQPKGSLLSLWTPKFSTANDPGFLMFLLIAFLIACISLPGLGDKLGTAPRIRNGIGEVGHVVRGIF